MAALDTTDHSPSGTSNCAVVQLQVISDHLLSYSNHTDVIHSLLVYSVLRVGWATFHSVHGELAAAAAERRHVPVQPLVHDINVKKTAV